MPEARRRQVGPRALRARLRAGAVLGGPIVVSGSAESVRLSAAAGFDWVTIDTEEASSSPFGREIAAQCAAARSVGVPPLVRVTENRDDMIAAALAAGAQGIWIPHLEDAAAAERLVAACARRRGAPAVSIAIVESVAGLDNVEEIARTPGLDVLVLGPFDLGVDIGIPSERIFGAGESWLAPELAAAADRTLAACRGRSVVPGTLAWSGESARGFVDMGFRFLLFGIDVLMLVEAAVAARSSVVALAGAGAGS